MKIFKPKYEQAPAPDRTPRPHRFIDAPATPMGCALDYNAGEDVRATMAKQEAKGRR
jgi:hypothetical protein